jgi:hypothetical protein
LTNLIVIASGAKQSRNSHEGGTTMTPEFANLIVIASEAKQSRNSPKSWIASSLSLLAMTIATNRGPKVEAVTWI